MQIKNNRIPISSISEEGEEDLSLGDDSSNGTNDEDGVFIPPDEDEANEDDEWIPLDEDAVNEDEVNEDEVIEEEGVFVKYVSSLQLLI